MNLRDVQTDVRLINIGRSDEQAAKWEERQDQMRVGIRGEYLLGLHTAALYDNWSDEEAALLLAGFPLARRDYIDQPAHDMALGWAQYILRLIDSGDSSRRPPKAWIKWADSKGVPMPSELRAAVDGGEPAALPERAETTYLNIIGGLLMLMFGQTPAGRPQSVYASQAAVIDALQATFPGLAGLSQRTLEEKFAAAKRSLPAS